MIQYNVFYYVFYYYNIASILCSVGIIIIKLPTLSQVIIINNTVIVHQHSLIVQSPIISDCFIREY